MQDLILVRSLAADVLIFYLLMAITQHSIPVIKQEVLQLLTTVETKILEDCAADAQLVVSEHLQPCTYAADQY